MADDIVENYRWIIGLILPGIKNYQWKAVK